MLLRFEFRRHLDFRSHFKFYLIKNEEPGSKRKLGFSLKRKAVTWLPDNKTTTEELQ
jgi:hypothetical protein